MLILCKEIKMKMYIDLYITSSSMPYFLIIRYQNQRKSIVSDAAANPLMHVKKQPHRGGKKKGHK